MSTLIRSETPFRRAGCGEIEALPVLSRKREISDVFIEPAERDPNAHLRRIFLSLIIEGNPTQLAVISTGAWRIVPETLDADQSQSTMPWMSKRQAPYNEHQER